MQQLRTNRHTEIILWATAIELHEYETNGSRSSKSYPLGTKFQFQNGEYIAFNSKGEVQKPVLEWAND